MYERFKARGLEVVSVDLQEPREAVARFREDLGVQFPVWIDTTGQSLKSFGVRGHPTTVLIDRAGRVVGRILGERDWRTREAHQLVEWLLRKGQ